jgi:hypothetical protein
MFHYKTVDLSTLDLLKRLQSLDELRSLRLAGGTSLALQYGHRKSIDLDLFGKLEIGSDELIDVLKTVGEVKVIKDSKRIHTYTIDGVKTDIVEYNYPWINDALVYDGLFLASDSDIAAMKLNAVSGRGTKKDFVDVFFLLKRMDLSTMIELFEAKYNDGSIYLVLRSLVYFDDAEEDLDPVMFEQYNWESIKVFISNAVKHYIAHFEKK